MILCAIDPGVNTGYAELAVGKLIRVETMQIHEAIFRIEDLRKQSRIVVVFEDARQRKWFGKAGREQLQGAGSIKRDCTVWQDYLQAAGVPYLAVKPKAGATKWTVEYLAQQTGWTARTSEHARDAAALAWLHRHYAEALAK